MNCCFDYVIHHNPSKLLVSDPINDQSNLYQQQYKEPYINNSQNIEPIKKRLHEELYMPNYQKWQNQFNPNGGDLFDTYIRKLLINGRMKELLSRSNQQNLTNQNSITLF